MIRVTLLRKINPKNTLFGRIFMMFWLSVFIMVAGAFIVGRMVGESWEVSASSEEQLQPARDVASFLQAQIERERNLKRVLRRASARFRMQIMVFDEQRQRMEYGFPRPLISQESKFISLTESHSPFLIRTANIEFVGPIVVTHDNANYFIFTGRMLRREQRPTVILGAAFVVFVVIGTLACVVIAYSIAKPIKRLRELSDQFATGNIEQPDQALAGRNDELGQLHQHMHSMASKLANNVEQQKALMANVSHELRTPLTRMQLAVAMLPANSEQNNVYANRIEKEIGVMDTLIGQSLQLAKIDHQRDALLNQREHAALSELFGPIIDDLKFEAQALGKTIEMGEYVPLSLFVNKTSFASAIENVTRNAIKYCNQMVLIHFSVTHKNDVKYVCISIEDDGNGLSTSQMEQIFEPFYKVPLQQKVAHTQSTGLGLAIAKASIELHKGNIKVLASSQGGLNMLLYFPIV
ncbi:MAG: ATP-binding protein [Glaciecola sp.]